MTDSPESILKKLDEIEEYCRIRRDLGCYDRQLVDAEWLCAQLRKALQEREEIRTAFVGCKTMLYEADAATGPEMLYPLGAPGTVSYACGDEGLYCHDCEDRQHAAITALSSSRPR